MRRTHDTGWPRPEHAPPRTQQADIAAGMGTLGAANAYTSIRASPVCPPGASGGAAPGGCRALRCVDFQIGRDASAALGDGFGASVRLSGSPASLAGALPLLPLLRGGRSARRSRDRVDNNTYGGATPMTDRRRCISAWW